jgi:hypothetical protein
LDQGEDFLGLGLTRLVIHITSDTQSKRRAINGSRVNGRLDSAFIAIEYLNLPLRVAKKRGEVGNEEVIIWNFVSVSS